MPYKDLKKRRLAQRRYRNLNLEKMREKSRKYARENKIKFREYQLKKKYGLTLEEYNLMLFDQKNCCKICGNTATTVDHCHTNKKIRGLLCNKCNILLGNAKDSIIILQSAINYLKQNE